MNRALAKAYKSVLLSLWNSIWIVRGLSSITVFEGSWSIFEQQWYNWDNSATFSLSDFHKPSVKYLIFSPHTTLGNFNHSTTEWLRGMIIIFQTFGSFYYPIGSTLRTHWGDDVPSVSHVGSNQMRVLTLTISREKTFASGELWSTCRLCEQWAGL